MVDYLEKILVSACLLGEPVRYDGRSKKIENTILKQWRDEGRLVIVCPEVNGGLAVPRPAAEITSGSAADILDGHGTVMTQAQDDVTKYFLRGAEHALALCQQHAINVAILKENSPSCGSSKVHDGSFSHSLVAGEGITTALLRRHGIRVYSEHDIVAVAESLHTAGAL